MGGGDEMGEDDFGLCDHARSACGDEIAAADGHQCAEIHRASGGYSLLDL